MRGRLARVPYRRLIAPQVGRRQPQPLLRADDSSQLRPLRLEAFLAFDLFAFGDLFEVGVDLRPFGLGEFELRQPAFVVERHSGAVFDRALNVVDADVVAEDRARARGACSSAPSWPAAGRRACGGRSRR
jgi:hypothetical protein